MRKLAINSIIGLSIFCFGNLNSQNNEEKYLDKVQTIENTLETLYSVISGDKGVERNWELFKYLFKPDANLIPARKSKDGVINVNYISPQGYIDKSGAYLVEHGFHEVSMKNEVHRFGPIAQVFSSYQAFKSKSDTEPFMRGINSIQMLFDENRWWIINIYWTQESEKNKIPKQYLPN